MGLAFCEEDKTINIQPKQVRTSVLESMTWGGHHRGPRVGVTERLAARSSLSNDTLVKTWMRRKKPGRGNRIGRHTEAGRGWVYQAGRECLVHREQLGRRMLEGGAGEGSQGREFASYFNCNRDHHPKQVTVCPSVANLSLFSLLKMSLRCTSPYATGWCLTDI